MSYEKITVDKRLYEALGEAPQTLYDLKNKSKAIEFDRRRARGYTGVSLPGWIEFEEGDFSVIGEMKNLHTLIMKSEPGIHYNVKDFSFLRKCVKLKKLDLTGTNFTDCRLLANLPALKYVCLPPKKHLCNTDVLEQLSAKVDFISESVLKSHNKKPLEAEKVQLLVEALKKKTAMPAYKLEILENEKPDIFMSKFGGLPYWDLSKEYPVDSNGAKMMLLAQINFTDAALDDDRLPKRGMLQFFIWADVDNGYECLYGMDSEALDTQKNWRVVYHEEIDRTVTQEQILQLGVPTNATVGEYNTPICEEVAVKIEKTTAYIFLSDYRFDDIVEETLKELFGNNIREKYAFDYDSEDNEEYFDDFFPEGHRILGYPICTQPQLEAHMDEKTQNYYDTLLFQMDSDEFVEWGDAGVANFFINSEALRNCDFSRVWYYWDCT